MMETGFTGSRLKCVTCVFTDILLNFGLDHLLGLQPDQHACLSCGYFHGSGLDQ